MKAKNRRLLMLLLLIGLCGPTVLYADDTIDIGIFPRRGPAVTEKMFRPLTDYLQYHLGRPVRLHTSVDFASFWEKVANNEFDLVHFNQYHYLRSHRDFGYRVILHNEEFGESSISSAIFVRRDSNIRSLQDLRGRKIVFGGGRMAMISYIVNTYLLRKAGLNEGDYLSQFALNPPKALVAMYYRQADAAGGGKMLLAFPRIREQLDTGEVRILAEGPPLAHLPWAVNKQVPDVLASQLQSALSSMAKDTVGKQALSKARLTNLVVSSDHDFDPHREMVRFVLKEDY